MGRVIAGVAVAGLVLGIPAGAGAATSAGGPGNGCAVSAPSEITGVSTQTTCQYVAGTTTGAFAAMTPDHWVISIGNTTVAQGSADSPNPAGTYTQAVGDTVTVILFQDCAPTGMPCGSAGVVAAGDAS